MEKKKMKPVQQAHLPIYRVCSGLGEIGPGKAEDTRRQFLPGGKEILHDLPGRLTTVVQEQGV